ncbi:MAG: RNA-binding protein [Firmicutes bacterium]|nr:RNA-binding protein [Bacillota bacterium]
MEKDEKLLLASAEDKARQCERNSIPTHTGFLSLAQQAILEKEFPGACFWGGCEDAERRILVFLPEWMAELPACGEDCPLAILRVTLSKGSPALTHRDYLGSLLALGVDRSVAGDIFVREDGADIFVLRDMAEFLRQHYTQAGRAALQTEVLEPQALRQAAYRIVEKRDTVASLRLDCVLAGMFDLSRGHAQEAVRQGLVAVNGRLALKPDAMLAEGDKVSLRGKGKAVLKEIGGKSRKDRDCIVYARYL